MVNGWRSVVRMTTLLLVSLLLTSCSSIAATSPFALLTHEASAHAKFGWTAILFPSLMATRPPSSVSSSNLAPATPVMPYETAVRLFDYDRQAPLDVQEVSAQAKEGVTVHDISYASPKGGRAPAFLVVPERQGSFPGIIIQHGLPGNRSNFLPYAINLAKIGAVVLVTQAAFNRSEPPNQSYPTFTERDRDTQVQLIVDLQRAVDLLSAQSKVDGDRLAYIGYSYGGMMGGILAGVERRIKAYVLAVGDGGMVTHFTRSEDKNSPFNRLSPEQKTTWLEAMLPIESIYFVPHAAPAALFFQSGLQDDIVQPSDGLHYQQTGSEPKVVKWYDAGHGLSPEAFKDQIEWLHWQVGLGRG
jgi:cephalosporin-C deacetylase-like acetyl esterase